MPGHFHRTAIALMTIMLCGCRRPPSEGSNSANSQSLPFGKQSRSVGDSPRPSLIPSTTKLPEGTPIPIRMQSALSSASSHAGDIFSAVVDEPVVINGQTLVERGAPATGRVLEAKPSAGSREGPDAPHDGAVDIGYLRVVLVNLTVGGRVVAIETCSIFAKGGPREERNPATGPASGPTSSATSGAGWKGRDVVFGVDRRLNFRLAQAVDLQ